MLAQPSLQAQVVVEWQYGRQRAAWRPSLSWRRATWLLVPIVLAVVVGLADAQWLPTGLISSNSGVHGGALPVPAPTAGKAAWVSYYRSLVGGSTLRVTSSVRRPVLPQVQLLPVDPTRLNTLPAPRPVATPQPAGAG